MNKNVSVFICVTVMRLREKSEQEEIIENNSTNENLFIKKKVKCEIYNDNLGILILGAVS